MNFFDSQLIYALGWTIVHSFWQCLLVFMLLKFCLLLSKQLRAEMRYCIAAVALICCGVISIKTFINGYQDVVEASLMLSQLQQVIGIADTKSWWTSIFQSINPWLDVIVLLWSLGFIVQAFKYSVDMWFTQRLKHQATEVLPDVWYQRFLIMQGQLGLTKKVQFLQSAKVLVPCIIGHFKPVVLLPLGLISQLPQAQVEAIVLHELAHIRRHDYLVNILQCLLKVVFFFNPFVYAICKVIDRERENACDDIAVQTCGDPIAYAHSLSQFAQIRLDSHVALAINKNKWLLLARVQRLFARPGSLSYATERLLALCCVSLLGLSLSVHATNQQSPAILLLPISSITDQIQAPAETQSTSFEHAVKAEESHAETKHVPEQTLSQSEVSNPELEHTPIVLPQSLAEAIHADAPSQANQPESRQVSSPKSADNMSQNAAADYLTHVDSQQQPENENSKDATTALSVEDPKEAIKMNVVTSKAFSYLLVTEAELFKPFTHIVYAPIDVNKLSISSHQAGWQEATQQYFNALNQNEFTVMRLEDNKLLNEAEYPNAKEPSLVAQIRLDHVVVEQFKTRLKVAAGDYDNFLPGYWNNNAVYVDSSNVAASMQLEIVIVNPKTSEVMLYAETAIDHKSKSSANGYRVKKWQTDAEQEFWTEILSIAQIKVSQTIIQLQSLNKQDSADEAKQNVVTLPPTQTEFERAEVAQERNAEQLWLVPQQALSTYTQLVLAPIDVSEANISSNYAWRDWKTSSEEYLQELSQFPAHVEPLVWQEIKHNKHDAGVSEKSLVAQIRIIDIKHSRDEKCLREIPFNRNDRSNYLAVSPSYVQPLPIRSRLSRLCKYTDFVKSEIEFELRDADNQALFMQGVTTLSVNGNFSRTEEFNQTRYQQKIESDFWRDYVQTMHSQVTDIVSNNELANTRFANRDD